MPAASLFSGRVYRQTGPDTPAFPPSRPAPVAARYHRAGQPWPLYAALVPATAWAEWQAATGGAVNPADEQRRLWTMEVEALPILDLRDPEVMAAVGVDRDALVGERSVPQRIADRARRMGAAGLIAPSAAHSDGWSLVVFPEGFDRVRAVRSRLARPRPPGSARMARAHA